ncbi:hypothetical protein BDC45DRAFT_515615 [Circinella umbellata]|nr:hypothetical protein BDC45DRAFT_515615 [Circinella umbellata]
MKKDPVIKKIDAHRAIINDIRTLIEIFPNSTAIMEKLKKLKGDAKTANKNQIITNLWRRKTLNAAINQERKMAETRLITATINKEADAINNRINNDLDSKLNGLDVDNDDNGSTDNNDNGQKDNDEYYLEECQKSLENRDIARHELFRWAFKLQTKNEFSPMSEIIDPMREKCETDMDNLNRLSITILDNWDDSDDILEQILRITLSGIIDISHDWVAYYIKHAFSESRWASLTNTQTLQLAELTHKSDNIFDNVIKLLNFPAFWPWVGDNFFFFYCALGSH